MDALTLVVFDKRGLKNVGIKQLLGSLYPGGCACEALDQTS